MFRWLFRQQDRYYGTDMLMMGMGSDLEPEGIENRTQSAGNIYEYRDLPIKHGRRPASTPASIRSSDGSLAGRESVNTAPNGRPKTPPIKRPISRKSLAASTASVPMTQVWCFRCIILSRRLYLLTSSYCANCTYLTPIARKSSCACKNVSELLKNRLWTFLSSYPTLLYYISEKLSYVFQEH